MTRTDYSAHFTDMYPHKKGTRRPIYSYGAVSARFYDALMNSLINEGMTEEEAIHFCGSKQMRWGLESGLGEMIESIAQDFASYAAPSWIRDNR
jgi:hypothetical protein